MHDDTAGTSPTSHAYSHARARGRQEDDGFSSSTAKILQRNLTDNIMSMQTQAYTRGTWQYLKKEWPH